MPRNARIPKVDRTDPRLREIAQSLAEITDEQCGPSATFLAQSKATNAVGEEILRLLAQQRRALRRRDDD